MASNEAITENSNTRGDENTNSETFEPVQVNNMVLLVRIEHVDGRPMGPEIWTEAAFKELCHYTMNHMLLKFSVHMKSALHTNKGFH